MAQEQNDNDLPTKVSDWLKSEGYPLEFLAANIMRRSGLGMVRQGQYVRSADVVREIDVLASKTYSGKDDRVLIRAYQVVECKWSKDKPWVIFVSPHSRIMESACAAQTISSEYGEAAMWAIAGDDEIKAMKLFASPQQPGFNGREAFSKGVDRFYNSMKSVTDITTMLVKEYDKHPRQKGNLPECLVVAFPIILVEGRLFEAYFSSEDGETKTREVQHVRCHWRGSPTWNFHATIDVVSLDAFEEFCATRASETEQLIQSLIRTHERVKACVKAHSIEPLKVRSAGRGRVGVPPLLAEALRHGKVKREG